MLTKSPAMTQLRKFQILAAVLMIAGIFMTGIGQANASSDCGEYSFGFAGTRLLNDGISTSAGPFPIVLPAGTFDDHVAHPGQHDQTAEQFYVELDSGWISPPSTDIADDQTSVTTVHGAQVIADSTAISVHHVGVGNVNSVDVVCVGFTPSIPADVAEVVEEPAADASPDPIDPLMLVRPDEEPKPKSIPRQTKPIDPLSLQRPVDSDEIEPAVQGQVETPPVLALTGPGDSTVIALVGLALLMTGTGLVATERRLRTVTG